ncbi:MAG: hypothetical protein HY506_01860 [Candidatus Yanofskybacteria bacterium]|nr:hypothetical protein [Candidatus Yanofskybacteria bacterium]
MNKKSALLLCLVAASSVSFWFSVEPWIKNPFQFSHINTWLKPLISLGLFSALIGLSFLIIRNGLIKFAVSIIAGLPFLFVFDFNQFYLIAFALIVLLHSSAAKDISKQATERIKIDIREIMGHGLPSVITPILLLISFAFFFSPEVQKSASQQELPPTAKQVMSRVIGGFLGGEIEQLPPQEQKVTEELIVDKVFDQFNQVLSPYFKFLPPVLAFGLFLILQGLRFIFVWTGAAMAVILFWALRKTGFIKTKILQKEAEEIEPV